jgi:trehalose 6-phosphate phosphatase
MENLFSAWPDLQEQIQRARQILLLSDYDGTLTPIVDSPDAALIAKDTRQLLVELAALTRFKVGFISGRSLEDLKNKVNINGIVYAGNHGFEIDGPGLRFINPVANEIRPFLRLVRQILTSAVGTIKGVFVEDKGLTLSVHYRQVDDEQIPRVRSILERILSAGAIRGIVKMTHGKKVYEVRPAVTWDKGKAIRLLMHQYSKGGRSNDILPIYLGDDLTDEDGFKMIERYGKGIAVHVGCTNKASAADYYLDSTDDVDNFLSRLLELSSRRESDSRSLDTLQEIDLSPPTR